MYASAAAARLISALKRLGFDRKKELTRGRIPTQQMAKLLVSHRVDDQDIRELAKELGRHGYALVVTDNNFGFIEMKAVGSWPAIRSKDLDL